MTARRTVAETLCGGDAAELDELAAEVVRSCPGVLDLSGGVTPTPTRYLLRTSQGSGDEAAFATMAPYPTAHVLAAEGALVCCALVMARNSPALGLSDTAGVADVSRLLGLARSTDCPDPYCNRLEFRLLAQRFADGTSGYQERLLEACGYDWAGMLGRDEHVAVRRYLDFSGAFVECGEVPSMATLAAADAKARFDNFIDVLVGLGEEGEDRA